MFQWFAAHGPQAGVRIPNVRERARALGLEQYCDALGLGEREMYDAQGNSFDQEILHVRIGAALGDWARGARRRHNWLPPLELLQTYRTVQMEINRPDETRRSPFPADLWEGVLSLFTPLPTPSTSAAAPHESSAPLCPNITAARSRAEQ